MEFLKRYVTSNGSTNFPEMLDLDEQLTSIPYIVLPETKIEPDDWKQFWKIWEAHKMSASNLGHIWDMLYIYLNPNLSDHEIRNSHPGPVLPGQYLDFTTLFPRMMKTVLNLMPYKKIDKISLCTNTKRVPAHIDATPVYYPWPNSMRVMLWDSNDSSTFYLTKWPKHSYKNPPLSHHNPKVNETYFNEVPLDDKIYVNLPTDSNTFIYSNGAYLHGADLAKPKIIMIIWGEIDPEPWKAKLREIICAV